METKTLKASFVMGNYKSSKTCNLKNKQSPTNFEINVNTNWINDEGYLNVVAYKNFLVPIVEKYCTLSGFDYFEDLKVEIV